MAEGNSPPKEKRRLRRNRALLSAVGVSADGTMTFDFAIRDLSANGCKIRTNGIPFPDRFYLINIRDQVAHDAIVTWKKNGEAGLQWNDVIPLVGNAGTSFEHLWRIWAERAPR